jgi:hypothetical protein
MAMAPIVASDAVPARLMKLRREASEACCFSMPDRQ